MPYPMFVEKTKDGDKTWDVYSRMLSDRIIFLNGAIGSDSANHIIAQLLLLESQSKNSPITMYINSPGGAVTHGLAIYDTMQYILSPINTVVIGQAASMASLLAQAGDTRYITKYGYHMVHRVSSGTSGTSGSVHIQELEMEDARRHLEHSKSLNSLLTDIYAKHNTKKKSYEDIFETMKFDTFFNAEESFEYGLVDEIVERRPTE